MGTVLARFEEPSTWVGLAAILIAAGQGFPHASSVFNGLAVIAGAIGMAVPELTGRTSPAVITTTVPGAAVTVTKAE